MTGIGPPSGSFGVLREHMTLASAAITGPRSLDGDGLTARESGSGAS